MLGNYEDNLIKLILLYNKPFYKESVNDYDEPIPFLK